MHTRLSILYEDNHLLVVEKPAGLATMGTADGESSLVLEAKEYLRFAYDKPGNVYLGVVSRLDRMSTGVMVLARTSKAAARLSEQFRKRSVAKTYWALIAGRIDPPHGTLEDYVRKDESQHRMVTCAERAPHAKLARLDYRTLASSGSAQHLEIELDTGRKHQIRLQLSCRGLPILGDRKYGSSKEFPNGIALHSRRLELDHPTTKERMEFVAKVPGCWKHFM